MGPRRCQEQSSIELDVFVRDPSPRVFVRPERLKRAMGRKLKSSMSPAAVLEIVVLEGDPGYAIEGLKWIERCCPAKISGR